MEQEYKVGLFGKIFYGLCAGSVLVFFLVLIFSIFIERPFALLVLLPIMVFCVLVLSNIFKSKVIITDTGITRKRIFYERTLQFQDIKGCRIGEKVIIIEPKDAITPKA